MPISWGGVGAFALGVAVMFGASFIPVSSVVSSVQKNFECPVVEPVPVDKWFEVPRERISIKGGWAWMVSNPLVHAKCIRGTDRCDFYDSVAKQNGYDFYCRTTDPASCHIEMIYKMPEPFVFFMCLGIAVTGLVSFLGLFYTLEVLIPHHSNQKAVRKFFTRVFNQKFAVFANGHMVMTYKDRRFEMRNYDNSVLVSGRLASYGKEPDGIQHSVSKSLPNLFGDTNRANNVWFRTAYNFKIAFFKDRKDGLTAVIYSNGWYFYVYADEPAPAATKPVASVESTKPIESGTKPTESTPQSVESVASKSG